MPASKHGKICYIELPAEYPARSAQFYREIFGWSIRTRGDGAASFDDSIGSVSGSFDTAKTPAAHSAGVVYRRGSVSRVR